MALFIIHKKDKSPISQPCNEKAPALGRQEKQNLGRLNPLWLQFCAPAAATLNIVCAQGNLGKLSMYIESVCIVCARDVVMTEFSPRPARAQLLTHVMSAGERSGPPQKGRLLLRPHGALKGTLQGGPSFPVLALPVKTYSPLWAGVHFTKTDITSDDLQ